MCCRPDEGAGGWEGICEHRQGCPGAHRHGLRSGAEELGWGAVGRAGDGDGKGAGSSVAPA
jgi:hypothetical protein